MNIEDFEHIGYVLLDPRNSLFGSVYTQKEIKSTRRKAAEVIQFNSHLK
ncbi:hypothetical protein [Pseudalkalibacillus hwajinpoensis]|nr:hypothetical protein [Pseudalkalibacillus hwajinpoensis]